MSRAHAFHAFLFKTGLQNQVYQINLLLQSYINSGFISEALKLLHFFPNPNFVSYNTLLSAFFSSNRIEEALKLFSDIPQTDSRSWNILISGFIKHQRSKDAITHFLQMRHSSFIRPDNFTYSILIPCCDLGIGRQLHSDVIKLSWNLDPFIGTTLMKMYAEVGVLNDAHKLFDDMSSHRDLVTWNTLISCYSKFGNGEMSLKLFQKLFQEGVLADEFTYAIVLKELETSLQVYDGMKVHSLIIRNGFCSDRFTNNSMVNLYSKCGFINDAYRLFKEILDQDVVSWTSMIVGFSQGGLHHEAMLLFDQMRLDEVKPNSFTFGSLFSACATKNAFLKGKQLHSLVLKYGLEMDMIVGSSIIDMYSKCGEMSDAFRHFQSMPERDLVSWNGMISGFAQNGKSSKALEVFDRMVGSTTLVPNDVTFIGVLSACSHGGLVDESRHYFRSMVHEYFIEPKIEHYTCMVDTLARAGLLKEAEALILGLPFKPDTIMWGALLGACKLYKNLDMARSITERLCSDEPDNSSNYVLLANTYTDNGEWGNALEVREVMESRGTQKILGCSWIEVRNFSHCFEAGQKNHPQFELIYDVLQRLFVQMNDKYFIELLSS